MHRFHRCDWLPIETGRWNNVELEDRKCNLCDMNTVLKCPFLTDERKNYSAPKFYHRPNIIKYETLLSSKDDTCLRKHYIHGKIRQFNSA